MCFTIAAGRSQQPDQPQQKDNSISRTLYLGERGAGVL